MVYQVLDSRQDPVFSLEFLEPCIVLAYIHTLQPGHIPDYLAQLETLLTQHLPPGAAYYLVVDASPQLKRNYAFSPEDAEAFYRHSARIAALYRRAATFYIMNEGLMYQLNRTVSESISAASVHRTDSFSEALRRIEEDLGQEIELNRLPMSCC